MLPLPKPVTPYEVKTLNLESAAAKIPRSRPTRHYVEKDGTCYEQLTGAIMIAWCVYGAVPKSLQLQFDNNAKQDKYDTSQEAAWGAYHARLSHIINNKGLGKKAKARLMAIDPMHVLQWRLSISAKELPYLPNYNGAEIYKKIMTFQLEIPKETPAGGGSIRNPFAGTIVEMRMNEKKEGSA